MADPRAATRYDSEGQTLLTFKYDSTIVFSATTDGGSASINLAVTMVGNSQVGLTQDGNMIVGKLKRVEADGYCTVQVEGGMTLPAGNGATVTNGSKPVGALGAASAKGYIRNAAALTGSYVQTTQQDAINARGFIIDASDSTNVAIWLS